jgi:hypothetical protein
VLLLRRRHSTAVIFPAVEKSTVKPRISRHIYAGTRARGLLFAIGCFVESVSRDLTNFKGTYEHIQARKDSLVLSVPSVLCGVITCPNMSRPTVEGKRLIRIKVARMTKDWAANRQPRIAHRRTMSLRTTILNDSVSVYKNTSKYLSVSICVARQQAVVYFRNVES